MNLSWYTVNIKYIKTKISTDLYYHLSRVQSHVLFVRVSCML